DELKKALAKGLQSPESSTIQQPSLTTAKPTQTPISKPVIQAQPQPPTIQSTIPSQAQITTPQQRPTEQTPTIQKPSITSVEQPKTTAPSKIVTINLKDHKFS